MIQKTIQKLTLEEKAALLQGWTTWTTLGIPRLQIPEMFMADGPHGLRKQAGPADHLGLNASLPATCFPTAATIANSWDPKLGEELGQALGEEAAACDVHMVLGPGLNMKRSPLCGRNFEYFSEDPYLAGKMAAAYIRGIQQNGVAACPKHFAVNSQELRRMSTDSVLDERTLREIYLTGFEIAVKEGKAKAIMSSYNLVNGTYANENAHLLTEILRKQWGFDGFVVTDWGADNQHTEGVKAGSALVMPTPGPGCAAELVDAVRSGKVKESQLDARLQELLPVILRTTAAVKDAPKTFDIDAHHALAQKCAENAIVLLENDGILPLKQDTGVAIIGDFADAPRYQGAGSSLVNPTRVDSFRACAEAAGMHVTAYAQGYHRASLAPDGALMAEAVAAAKEAEAVLLCVGLDEVAECEGMDRQHMLLGENHRKLIEAVCEANKNVVLILSGGAPFVLPKAGRAVVHGYLGGQAGSAAMVNVLLGKVNPSGKLSETWPESLEDTPAYRYFPGKERTAEYREGLFIGYRYYETAGVPVRYPFGYGLSYTKFQYSDLKVDGKAVSFTLTNTGDRDGAEVAQVYVSCRTGKVFRPRKELKGFRKVFLKAGESRHITVTLDDKAFRYFNTATGKWEVETANYDILVGSSACAVHLSTAIRVVGSDAPNPYGSLPSYESGKVSDVSDEEFEALLGHPIPESAWGGEITRNDTFSQLYYSKSLLGRLIYKVLTKKYNTALEKGDTRLSIFFIYNMPLRGVGKMVGRWISQEMVDDMAYLFNGHFFRGAGRFIRDFFRNQRRSREFMKALKNKIKIKFSP